MNIQLAVKQGTNILKDKYIRSAKLDSEILMAKAIGKNREDFILNNDIKLKHKNLQYFKRLILERATRKPIAYLLKKKFFWNNEFFVNKDTLIPRPDTEILIQETLRVYKNKEGIRVLDIGVGSGCIILSILKDNSPISSLLEYALKYLSLILSHPYTGPFLPEKTKFSKFK